MRAKSDRAERVAELVHSVEDAVVRAVSANQGVRDEIVTVLAKITQLEVHLEKRTAAVELASPRSKK
jgi:hypothetical protein